MAWLVEKGATAEERVIKKHLLAALIEHSFNILFLVIFVGYILLVFIALKYYDVWVAIGGIAFMSPYFVIMLRVIPLLKDIYIEKYATDLVDANVAGKAPAGKM